MEALFGVPLVLGLGFFVIMSFLLPWIHRSKIQNLREELDVLKRQQGVIVEFVEKLAKKDDPQTLAKEAVVQQHDEFNSGSRIISDIVSRFQESQQDQFNQSQQPSEEKIQSQSFASEINDVEVSGNDSTNRDYSESESPQHQKKTISFEQQFGARLPVWIGGIALALAGFFLVKYSIETGLLSPAVRVALGTIFGFGLFYAADRIRNKPNFSDGSRISQALTGAAIADLYVCVFAATNLYHLVPTFFGFVGMAAITAIAVILSLRYGAPIALLGLIGGFLTPSMLSSNQPSAPLLFTYLYLVATGLMIVSRKQCWWLIKVLTIIGSFLWVLAWIFGGHFTPNDSLCLGLFLIAISATVAATSQRDDGKNDSVVANLFENTSTFNHAALGGALLLMGITATRAGFGLMEWSLFFFLSLGGIVLAYRNQRTYEFVPLISMAVNAVMLMVWPVENLIYFAFAAAAFATLYMLSGYLLQSRSKKPLVWIGLVAATSIGYYLLSYFRLRNFELTSQINLFWGYLALALSGLGVCVLRDVQKRIPKDHEYKQHFIATYASLSSAFLTLALLIELSYEFLSVAISAQMFFTIWISTKVDVKALRNISVVLAGVFGILIIPQIALLLQIAANALIEAKMTLQSEVPTITWPLFQLGLPALFFAGGAYIAGKQKDEKILSWFISSAISLIAVMFYYLIRHAFNSDQDALLVQASFTERGVITNVLFIYGLACLWFGRKFTLRSASVGGMALFGISIFRVIYFDLMICNPFWSTQSVGGIPLLNSLLLTYGLTSFWIWKSTSEMMLIGEEWLAKYVRGLILLLVFMLISSNIAQLFHGSYINASKASNAEIYSYSAAWLLFGIVILLLGTVRKDKMIRIASLVIMLVTIGKVFLYDASELEGLLRVFSFLGLGLSLLGLSWFYTRFVFTTPLPAENNR